MGFLKNLFGKESDTSKNKPVTKTTEAPQKEPASKDFIEKDNLGTRHDTLSKATSYWIARMPNPKKDPFVMYTFDKGEDAQQALLELPCIHVAKDTHNLICTEVLIFGYYRTDAGKYEAVICGDSLTPELWQKAVDSFTRHGGTRKNDLAPEKGKAPAPAGRPANAAKVKFVREDRSERNGVMNIYRIHSAPDAASAQEFLKNNPVAKNFYYIVVETPEGNYGRDIDGIYKE
jgi:hypothetical protein